MKVDFENPPDFEYAPDAPIWNRPAGLTLGLPGFPEYPYNHFEPEHGVVHSGSTSAKLTLENPVTNAARRIHLQTSRDPWAKHLWFEGWYYIPLNTKVDNWTELHRSLYDQIIIRNPNPPPTYDWNFPNRQWFKLATRLSQHTRVTDNRYRLRGDILNGQIDDNGDGQDDVGPPTYVDSIDTFDFGKWNHIRTYVFRDKVNGRYKMWLNGVLQWDISPMRTIGVDPIRFNEPDLNWQSGISSGISLYSGGLVDINVCTPKHAYYDDLKFSDEALATHRLSGDSHPLSGVPLTVNGISYETPFSADLEEGVYTLTMPSNVLVGADTWNFKQWRDGVTSPSRTVNLVADTAHIADYEKATLTAIQVHASKEGGEVIADGVILETGQTFQTPDTITVNPGTYNVECTYAGDTRRMTATVEENQTIRLDFDFTTPISPFNLKAAVAAGGITFAATGNPAYTAAAALIGGLITKET